MLLLSFWASGAAAIADRGYEALRAGRYDEAVEAFSRALSEDPGLRHVRKDLAYTLLRRGDREEARDQFDRLRREDPSDETSALEYAFLCYETRKVQEARRTFHGLRLGARDENVRRAAAEAFERVDRPLREGIEQWSEAVRRAPQQWSAHEELARLAEMRDELTLAAEHYELAWKLRPQKYELLIDLARVWKELGREAQAHAALTTAWRRGSTRIGELAREMMQGRAPTAGDAELAVPAELPAVEAAAAAPLPPYEMGERSLAASFVQDAYRYFRLAVEENPDDARAQYMLGVTANLLKKDQEALRWFARARRAADPDIAARAQEGYLALIPKYSRFTTDVWAIPFFSSRWRGGFAYGQVKSQWRLRGLPVSPYLSLRFVGDTAGARQAARAALPLYLSEKSVIGAVGASRVLHPTTFAWFEAGRAFAYGEQRFYEARSRWDARGGISMLKGWGRLLGSREKGWFHELNLDGVYASRFRHDLLVYAQNRSGYTLAETPSGLQAQIYLVWNVTADRRSEYWGNFAEAGLGVRLRGAFLSPGMSWRAEFVRGAHLRNELNPWGPNYWDFRTGIWYAHTRY
ncbi:MAG: tetratricopeptide repeat protein [Bryobacteraceae bacterium]|nr:tetratricopeptide repeat protein [Bryobacteraceae bacterium]